MTIKAGVIGWPIDHSLSPVLHGYWLDEYKIDGKYEREAIRPSELTREKLEWLRDEKKWTGLNVTVPHKEAAFSLADEVDKAAEISRAANLLIFGDGGHILAKNTDGFGLGHALLERLGGTLSGKSVVMLGAGGAARGGILALQARGVRTIYVLNRNPERAEKLAASMGSEITATLIPGPFMDWPVAAKEAALLLNTTSAGMQGKESLALDLAMLPTSAAVCDIVYNPLDTQLLKDAKARGLKIIDGLGMLMYQAVPSFGAFFGKSPVVTIGLRAALEKELKTRG